MYAAFATEPERGASDHVAGDRKAEMTRGTVLGLFRNPAFLTATLSMAMWTFAVGGISFWVPEFLRRVAGLSTLAGASAMLGASTVINGILGTAIGGWIAQVWLRRNHRALYLMSAWSVLLTLPWGILLFFGPKSWAVPSLFAAEFFLFLSTGPLNTAIVNSVSAPVLRATSNLDQPAVYSSAGRYVFAADHRRDQRPQQSEHRPWRDLGDAGRVDGDSICRGALCAGAGARTSE